MVKTVTPKPQTKWSRGWAKLTQTAQRTGKSLLSTLALIPATLELAVLLAGIYAAFRLVIGRLPAFFAGRTQFVPLADAPTVSTLLIFLAVVVIVWCCSRLSLILFQNKVNFGVFALILLWIVGVIDELQRLIGNLAPNPSVTALLPLLAVAFILWVVLALLGFQREEAWDLACFFPEWLLLKACPGIATVWTHRQLDKHLAACRASSAAQPADIRHHPATNTNALYAHKILFDDTSHIVILSDCHRGLGDSADEFGHTEEIFNAALSHYLSKEFVYIELGDGEELWENQFDRRHAGEIGVEAIIAHHNRAYQVIQSFVAGAGNALNTRLFLVAGNHDHERRGFWLTKTIGRSRRKLDSGGSFLDNYDAPVYDGLLLEHANNPNHQILLVHGHQGDLNSDRHIPISRWAIKHVWKPLQLMGLNDPTRAATNARISRSIDRRIDDWTSQNKLPVIYGHTHAPFLRNIDKRLKEPTLIHHRINTGSCIQQGSVTAIEISPVCAEDREYFGQVRPLKAFSAFTGLVIRLVEWRMRFVGTRPVSATHIDDLAMGVQKHVLDIIPLGDFWWASTTAKDDDLDADESDD